jgi:hypothetical protein
VSFSRELKVRSFNNSINRASFLAEPTVDAFGHVNIVSAKKESSEQDIIADKEQ